MGQLSQFPFGDELPGILDKRCPAIVIADKGEYPSLASGGCALDGFLRVLANRFLTQDVFSSLSCRPVDFQVHSIRRSHTDDFNLWIGDHLTPVSGVTFEAKALLGSLRTRLHRVSTDNEPGENPALMKSIRNGPVRAAVNFAHPTHANHSDTDSTCHSDTFHVVKSQGYSLQRC